MRRRISNTAWLVGVLGLLGFFASACSAWAAGPSELKGFRHRAWTSEDGLGAVFDVQQAPDGYLWLTTSRGVLRFDGVHFQSVEEATNGAVQDSNIFAVFVSSSGGVWLTTRTSGFILWQAGRFTPYSDRRCTPTAQMGGVTEDRDGSLWIQGASGFFHLHGGTCQQMGSAQGYPGGSASGVLVDHAGTVWVKTALGPLLTLPRGEAKFRPTQYSTPPDPRTAFLHEGPLGSVWLSDGEGLQQVNQSSTEQSPQELAQHAHQDSFRVGDFALSGDASVWLATSDGIRRSERLDRLKNEAQIASGQQFTSKDGLTSNAIWKLLIDREGTLWVATNAGLDQFRRTPLSAVSFPSATEHEFALSAGDRGSIWTGNSDLALTRIDEDGTVHSFAQIPSVLCVRRDRNGTVWVASTGDVALWRSNRTGFEAVHYPNEKLSRVVSLEVDKNDAPWISTIGGGLYHLVQGQWLQENEALGKKPGVIGSMTADGTGNLWLAFSNKLVLWDGNHYQKFSFQDGPLNISVATMAVRGNHVWLAGRGGVVLFTRGNFYLTRWKDRSLPGRVSGIVESGTGDLWINGFSGITHVGSEELSRWLGQPTSSISAEHLDVLDGLPGFSAERLPEPSVVEASQGRLWFATAKGIASLDPNDLQQHRNRVVPPVVVTSVLADGNRYSGVAGVMLPVHTQNLEIDYTALSLAMPERVLFRYKMEGIDKGWQEAGTRRQAFYTKLPPGHYRFAVVACNNDGLWNLTGASWGISIAPVFYQTTWFKAVLALVSFCLMGWLVRLRIRSVTRQLQLRLLERLTERERIARELHDTLLQSLSALSLQYSAVARSLPPGDTTREALEEVLRQSDKAMREGRERVMSLRSRSNTVDSLTKALAEIGCGLQILQPSHFDTSCEGRPQLLDALIEEEVLLIAREAIVNAFTHAGAAHISVCLSFRMSGLRVTISDDGVGIPEEFLKAGQRSEHWGLLGMRERAAKIRAELHIRSRIPGGTHIDLKVPAAIAYAEDREQRPKIIWNIFRRRAVATEDVALK